MPDGRFAPSPTGDLHLGSLRTALLAWLFARSDRAAFRMRIEDLDAAASRPEIAARQLEDLRRLGLDWDGEVVRQSDERELFRDAIDQLVRGGATYPCYCSRREIREAAAAPHDDHGDLGYPGTCRDLTAAERARREADGRPAALRVRSDGVRLGFVDRVCGRYEGVVDDVVIRRNDGTPAYHLAVVVSDAAQGIGEVVRGDDLLPSTPRQLHLAHLLGLPAPSYAHVPLVLGPEGIRLAKRDGAISLADRVAGGATPAAVLGQLAHSLGLIEAARPVVPSELGSLADDFDPDRLPREPWRLTPDDLVMTP
jgi:glutamyl-tRNA synthetase